ncbi:MAG TPA: hypothetical protein VKT18_00325, partial [Acidimicrobiales bacterium]|nr:hypothetical protein [Acidimicrobiales bacterium]
HAADTLTVLTAAKGAAVGHVAHGTLDVSSPTSAVAETLGGRRLVFVAGLGGNVAELALTASGATVATQRLRVLHPIGCARRATAVLALAASGAVVEVCSTGVVTEWHASMGTVARSIPATTTRLTDATGLAVLGSTAYVTNTARGSAPDGVTSLSLSTGHRVRTVTNATSPAYAFAGPNGIASDGTDLWEINATGNTVDELTPGLGFVASSSTNLTNPGAVLATKGMVWVSSWSQSSMVTQFTVVNHALSSPWMMCNSNGPYKFSNPAGFALSGSSLWVANEGDNLVDQMNASSGALVATYT